MVLKFAYLVELTKVYQPAKVQCCRLSESSSTEGLQKHNDDVIMTSFHTLGFKISIFCETDYQPPKFQVPQLSESNFTEAGIRHP